MCSSLVIFILYSLLADCRQGFVMAAGTRGRDNTIEEGRAKDGGIVPGHAYTILQVLLRSYKVIIFIFS